jgi:hypothetical protein
VHTTNGNTTFITWELRGSGAPTHAGRADPSSRRNRATLRSSTGPQGALYATWEDPLSILGFTVVHGKIAGLHLVTDLRKLRHTRLTRTPVPDRGDPR